MSARIWCAPAASWVTSMFAAAIFSCRATTPRSIHPLCAQPLSCIQSNEPRSLKSSLRRHRPRWDAIAVSIWFSTFLPAPAGKVMHEYCCREFYQAFCDFSETGDNAYEDALKRMVSDVPYDCIVGNGYAAIPAVVCRNVMAVA